MIGRRLAQIRGPESQGDFATRLGVHKNTYARWERDEREPGASELRALVALGWNANWILTGEGPERLEGLQVAEDGGAYGSQEMSGQHLMVATELAEEALRGLWLPRNRFFDLVALIYDALTQGLPYAEIIAFARPAAKDMAGAGGNDDGGTEVGGEGAADPGRGAAAGG